MFERTAAVRPSIGVVPAGYLTVCDAEPPVENGCGLGDGFASRLLWCPTIRGGHQPPNHCTTTGVESLPAEGAGLGEDTSANR
jgi:hypothetical protein